MESLCCEFSIGFTSWNWALNCFLKYWKCFPHSLHTLQFLDKKKNWYIQQLLSIETILNSSCRPIAYSRHVCQSACEMKSHRLLTQTHQLLFCHLTTLSEVFTLTHWFLIFSLVLPPSRTWLILSPSVEWVGNKYILCKVVMMMMPKS